MTDVTTRMALPVPRATRIALLVARLFALLAMALGAFVLLGWQVDMPALTAHVPDLAGMKPNAAAGVIAAGLGLFCLSYEGIRAIARLIGFALILLGLVTVTQEVIGLDFGIDQALLPAGDPSQPVPSLRMAPISR